MNRKYWAMLPPSRSAARTVAAATYAEAAGLEGVFSFELGSNPWVPAAAVAASTSTLRIGTGIALALARPPFDTAVAALDLDHLTEGRFTPDTYAKLKAEAGQLLTGWSVPGSGG